MYGSDQKKDCTYAIVSATTAKDTKVAKTCYDSTADDTKSAWCFDKTNADQNCLYGGVCKVDTCGTHEHADDATATAAQKEPAAADKKKHSDWDAYWWF